MALQVTVIIALLLFLMFAGCPVMAAIGCTAVLSMVLFMDQFFWARFATIAYQQGVSPSQIIPPLFIIMSEFLAQGGIAEDIFALLNRLMRKIKGGLAMATTLTCTLFAALCGSSPATAASVGKIATSAMTKRKYRKDFAIGTVAGGGTLGIMIPPSVTLVGFGILTETSIAKLLIAGILPGLMLAGLMILSIVIRTRLNPALVGEMTPQQLAEEKYDISAYAVDLKNPPVDVVERASGKELLKFFIMIIPAMLLILLVFGTMYTGVATPTESAGFGAVGAFLVVLFNRRMSKKMLFNCLKSTARTTCMIVFLITAGFSITFVLAYLQIPSTLSVILINSGWNKYLIMTFVYVLWFIMGCLMDPGSMCMLTIPFLFTPLVELGFNPIWLGVVSTLMTEVGMITPPVGLNLFVLRATTDVEMKHIIIGSLPYVFVLLFGLVFLNIFPQIALFLPGRM